MKDNRGTFEFYLESGNITLALHFAYTDGIIREWDYFKLLRGVWKARTVGELRAIGCALAETLKARKRESQGG